MKTNNTISLGNYGRNILLYTLLLPITSVAQDNTWFTDVSAQLGFNVVHAGAIIGLDVNNDDYPDLITLFGNTDWKLYLNQQRSGSSDPKDRVFVDVTATSGLNDILLKDLAGAGDFNNDGNIDLVTNCWYHNLKPDCTPNPDMGSRCHLLLGDGNGHFTLKANSGLESLGPIAGTGLPSLDYDRDGNLDLYVATHYTSWCGVPQENFLMKGNGDGTFTNVSVSTAINNSEPDPAKPWLNPPPEFRSLFGANMTDWNNDCYPDILTAPYENCGYPFRDWNNDGYITKADTGNTVGYGQLLKNNGDGTFTDEGVTANFNVHYLWGDNGQGAVPWAAMPCDYDNDGDIDFMVLEVHGGNSADEARTCIFTNQGPVNNYKLLPEQNRIIRKQPMSSHHGDHNGFWTDFDNDGWADLIVGDAVYMPASDRMFFCKQDVNHQFVDITKELGFIASINAATISDRIRHPSVMIPMDYDMDGDDDVFKTSYNADDSLNFLVLRNDIANKSNYIKIKLLAPSGVNKNCIGARITVKAGGVKQLKEVYGVQGSWTNQYPLIQNFGVAGATVIDSIIVKWPDANCSQTVVTNVAANQFLRIDKQGINSSASVISVSDNFELFPNPVSSGELNLKFNRPIAATWEVYNTAGQKVVSKSAEGYTLMISVPATELQPGIYWVRVTDKLTGEVQSKTFVKISP